MSTQLDYAKAGKITKEMEEVALEEHFSPEEIRCFVADGEVVIPKNILRKNIDAVGIGEKLKTKVNANIGTSQGRKTLDAEIAKLHTAIKVGADAVMDLSTGGNLTEIRNKILSLSSKPVGTVPIYEMMVSSDEFSIDKFLDILTQQAKQGVDFFTIHSGIKMEHIPMLEKRLMKVVSRGGAYLFKLMKNTNQENPLYTHYDKILKICSEYDVTLSLGDGLRPGCIHDATDEAQISELIELGKLAQRARDAGVQVMIEGPGHVPLNQIKENMDLKTKYAGKTPFYVLGPLVTDIAMGYDHICGAIGGALAATYGASFLCYVTPREHLGLPDEKDVRDGVIASKIAAHAADIATGKKGAMERNNRISKARMNFDWDEQFNLAIDPEKAEKRREACDGADDDKVCSMCGDFCSMKISQE